MHQLTEKFEQALALKDEIVRLRNVNGFTKAALSMQWIMERVEKSGEDFSPDQFDIDATTLNDKLFEAFLSEPFDAPTDGAVAAPLEASTDSIAEPAAEAIAAEPEHVEPEHTPASDLSMEAYFEPQAQPQPQPEPQLEPPTELQPRLESQPESQPQPEPESATPSPPPVEEAPTLTDLLDQNLLLGFQRFTEIVSKLGEKTPSERKSVFAVLAMIARSSTDVARSQGKKDVLDFFQSVIKFITYVDTSGSAQNSRVTEIMREVGDRLSKALKERSNGPALLQSINQILQNPESSLKS
jgi:hypothetical protein